ncbi:hypothetical protein C0995_001331 [Termitomyces sp. Mi166|nr:hypothetical protein C0995_001331 [Termitomyces sp. Mi166\
MSSPSLLKSSRGYEIKHTKRTLKADNDNNKSPLSLTTKKPHLSKAAAAIKTATAAPAAVRALKKTILIDLVGNEEDLDPTPPPPISCQASISSSQVSTRIDNNNEESEEEDSSKVSKEKAPKAPDKDAVAQLGMSICCAAALTLE